MLVIFVTFLNLLFTLSNVAQIQRFLETLNVWLNILHMHHHTY